MRPGAAGGFAEPTFTLEDRQGCRASYRPLVQADRETVADLFAGLSERSRFRRFHALQTHLSDTQLRALFDLDYRDRFAWAVAVTCDGTASPVAVGRYARYGGRADADLALTVRDEWQGRGIGRSLLDTLIITAHHHGLVAFDTIVTADNEPMLHVLRQRGARLSPVNAGEVNVVLPFAGIIPTLADHPLFRRLSVA